MCINILRMSCTKYIPHKKNDGRSIRIQTGTEKKKVCTGLNCSPGREKYATYITVDSPKYEYRNCADFIRNDKLNCDNVDSTNYDATLKADFKSTCCKCADKSLRPPKKGGSINLTTEQAKELIKQIGGNSIKSTYITYNGKDAKILGYNKYIREFILQTNTELENVSIKNLLVNGKHVL